MEKRVPDTGGDYGYDLAHEAVGDQARDHGRDRARGGRAETRPGSAAHASGTGDRGQDLEYDEAHDF